MASTKKKPQKKLSNTDVIIVGGGIAGCVLAFHLANARKKVKIFDRRKREDLGHNWCDSIEKKAFSYAGIPAPKKSERMDDINQLAVISPNLHHIVHLKSYDYWIVDRILLQKRLINLAEKAGAEFFFETEITEPIGKGQWVVGVKKKDGEVETAKIVVDCSGRERILAKNIEVLDLNIKIEDEDIASAYRETYPLIEQEVKWGDQFQIESHTLYYRYGHEGGYSWINKESKTTIDVGAGIGKGISKRKSKAIVNEFVNSHKAISKENLRGGGGEIILRRPTTLVWYGFLAVGEAACQTIPSNGCGCGSAMIAAKIATEVILNALRIKEVSIDSLWEYQVRFTKERGRDLAALDAMRRILLSFSEEELSVFIEKSIISETDLQKAIHGKYPKQNIFVQILKGIRGIKFLKDMIKLSKGYNLINKIYRHYRNIPKEYSTREYHDWLLKQLYLFRKIKERYENKKSLKEN